MFCFVWLKGKEYGKEADWWAFAIILLEMILGNTPLDIYCDKRQITEDSELNTEILLRGKTHAKNEKYCE